MTTNYCGKMSFKKKILRKIVDLRFLLSGNTALVNNLNLTYKLLNFCNLFLSQNLKTHISAKKMNMPPHRVLVCSSIRGLLDAVKKSMKDYNNVHFEEIAREKLPSIKCRNSILLADNDVIGQVLKTNVEFDFIQGTWAGIDAILKEFDGQMIDTNIPVCRFAHESFSQLIAEYFIAQVISNERGFRQMDQWQCEKFWPTLQEKYTTLGKTRSLNKLTIGILGFGNMGKACARLSKVKLSINQNFFLQKL